jgi:hypothetical protein
MSLSERVTWETCPNCGRSAAVGWLDANPVEFDCPGGCQVSGGEFRRRAHGAGGVLFRVVRMEARGST